MQSFSQFLSKKITPNDTVSTVRVMHFWTNKFVKLVMRWTAGPWPSYFSQGYGSFLAFL